MQARLEQWKQYLLTGVSHVIPFIASGGILIALAISLAPMTGKGPDFSHSPLLKLILDIGGSAFALLLPVLAGYIAYARSGKPALVAGMVGGQIAHTVNAGFLGALIAGLLAGWVVELLKKLPVAKALKPLMPILIIPILSSLAIGALMFEVLGAPIADLMVAMSGWLKSMGGANAMALGALLGAMVAFDMGGPVNKVAFFFGASMIAEGQYQVMGAVAAAVCIPPLGLGLATKLRKSLWSEQEREAGSAALGMGMIGITEGAIPFAAADPLRVIPTIVAGSALGGMIAMLGGVGDHAPHGGPIVLPVIDNRLMFGLAILAGVLLVAVVINLLRARSAAPAESAPAA
ncbi:Phosphotransferase system, fructose-specific IIC component [Chromobacterium violaceum]|uniref:Protein-N p-phosphohistidine-sugar phosphotransferase n=1 Tax=Chromobacterium violaceum (strain ATCC 12472 / DSM 30191 / JCM 1249 / CCUG 213 / NBRC 12614 / NCIMB 9131 / NCTC 9757 / MK) TaxID=243365 RepID=Q7NVN3_CHRVO|nr:PTS fructose transporter subunit IIC [Chromobacterium violaceum]AAQ59981.1 protein-N p-phosphohistidine-sugar phosphotransferase [Chromobacterium violaceum ATCC 12472]MBP4044428.1 PTS fructose transporter subunit IIC [Chromobacterium violaceum]SUX35514.1 EIIBCA-Man [Chromobacterium violaceum]